MSDYIEHLFSLAVAYVMLAEESLAVKFGRQWVRLKKWRADKDTVPQMIRDFEDGSHYHKSGLARMRFR